MKGLIVLAVLVAATVTSPAPTQATSSAPAVERPNIVLITTDDQRRDDLKFMPYTRQLLGGHGVTFTRALSPHPLCCPARAEIVSGQYGQNNGVHHNEGAVYGGYQALRHKGNTVARWLDEAGYSTALVGKYLNGYKLDDIGHLGWDRWNPTVKGSYSYFNTTFHNNGNPVVHTDHVDDVVTDYAVGYIEEFAAQDAPFFVWASNLAPHGRRARNAWVTPGVADRHADLFSGQRNPARRKPSYATPVVNGHERLASPRRVRSMDRWHRARIRSLQVADEGVRDIVEALRRTGELDNTYIVFTTDNGYLLGEHHLVSKNYIFEEALRVPFLVRVPGTDERILSEVPVTIVDIAPTLADLAGAVPGRKVDGASFARLLAGGTQPWRDTQLIQVGHNTAEAYGWKMRGVRTGRWTYGHNVLTGTEQLYDRFRDPYQLVNVAGRERYLPVLRDLRQRTRTLKQCAGTECIRDFGRTPSL